MVVRSAEIPMSIYNFSQTLGNTFFKITNNANNASVLLRITDGNYDATSLTTEVNAKLQALGAPYTNIAYSISSNKSTFVCNGIGQSFTIEWEVNAQGSLDKYDFKRKLGWAFGFRSLHYTIISGGRIESEYFLDLTGLRYVYLAIEEFGKGNQNSFLGTLSSSLVKKKIIAKVIFNKSTFPFGTVIPANNYNGYLLTDARSYSGKIDIQKLNIQLVDDMGTPVNLNGLDFSFCIEVEHE
jgi:hypothetical protein